MSEISYEADHVKHSVGGKGGHLFRRSIHIGMCLIPWLYFEHGDDIADNIQFTRLQLAAGLGILILVAECIRLYFGITIVGQREYEAKQISALAWGAISVVLVFITMENWPIPANAEEGWLAYPLILSLTFGDPAMGEARRFGIKSREVFMVGSLVVFLTWGVCWHLFGTPLFLAFIMAPLTTAAEWPKLKWIDDNATMILIPLAAILMMLPFII
ncbi:MAG: hypothetical protein QF440_05120 [Candidatus Thalassarchaeaceae archaeon]|nr:hypothetical protein [Candidatus Thalassarchaeaceae archaeon]